MTDYSSSADDNSHSCCDSDLSYSLLDIADLSTWENSECCPEPPAHLPVLPETAQSDAMKSQPQPEVGSCSKKNANTSQQTPEKHQRRGPMNELQRLRQLKELKSKNSCRHTHHGNFLTYLRSEDSFMPRLRSSWRKALFHWFCAGEEDYSSPLVYKYVPLMDDHKVRVVCMLGNTRNALGYADSGSLEEVPQMAREEELGGNAWYAPELESSRRV